MTAVIFVLFRFRGASGLGHFLGKYKLYSAARWSGVAKKDNSIDPVQFLGKYKAFSAARLFGVAK